MSLLYYSIQLKKKKMIRAFQMETVFLCFLFHCSSTLRRKLKSTVKGIMGPSTPSEFPFSIEILQSQTLATSTPANLKMQETTTLHGQERC